MSKSLKALAGVIIVLFLLAVAGLIFLSTRAPEQASFPSGGVERATAAADEAGLNLTAVSPMDAYGDEFVAAVPVCPGTTPQLVMDTFGLPETPEGLPDNVDLESNYLLLIREDGTSAADEMSRSAVDFCGSGQLPPFNAAQMLPLMKSEEGGWVLAA